VLNDEEWRSVTVAIDVRARYSQARAEVLREAMMKTFATDQEVRVDYATVVDPETLLPLDDITHGALVAVAVWIGSTRLIDNLLLASRV